MQIVITLEEKIGLDSKISNIFGRCNFFMFINPDTKKFTIEENPAKDTPGGAGIQAAQFIADNSPAAVITGHLGPKAHTVLFSAGIPVYQFQGKSLEETLNDYNHRNLKNLFEADVKDHTGLK